MYYLNRNNTCFLLRVIIFINCTLLYGTLVKAQIADFTVKTFGDSCGYRSIELNPSNTTGGNIAYYSWDIDGAIITNSNNNKINRTFSDARVYKVKLTIKDAAANILGEKTREIEVYPLPIVDFEATTLTKGCADLPVKFKDKSNPGKGSITKWEWDFETGSSSETSPTFVFTTAGTYDVSLIVTNSYGCKNNDPKLIKDYIEVTAGSKPSFTTQNNSSCQLGHTVIFNNTSTLPNNVIYSWDFGDGTIPEFNNNKEVKHQYNKAGIFQVKLSADNGGSCNSSYISEAVNSVYIGNPEADFTLPEKLCEGTAINFNNNVLPDATQLTNTRLWQFSDGGNYYYHTFSTPGEITVTYTAANSYSGCKTPVVKKVNVIASPVADFSIDKPIGCQIPHIVTFTNKSSADANSFIWSLGNKPVYSVTEAATFINSYDNVGYYAVTLTAQNTLSGCPSLPKTQNIQIQKPVVDFVYSPKSGCMPVLVNVEARAYSIDGINEYSWDFGNGINMITNTPKYTYPYPAAGDFFIQLTVHTKLSCEATSLKKPLNISEVCDDNGNPSDPDNGGGGGGGGFTLSKNCKDKYTVILKDTVANTEVVQWDIEGDIIPGPQNELAYPFKNTKKKWLVKLTVKNKTTGIITIYPKRVVIIDEKANFTTNTTSICKNKTIDFVTKDIDSSNIKYYIWHYGDSSKRDTIDNEKYYKLKNDYYSGNATHQYTDTGVFIPKLIIIDKLGCADSMLNLMPIIVRGPIAKFSSSETTICKKTIFDVTFQDKSHANGAYAIINRVWKFDNGTADYNTTLDTAITKQYTNYNSYKPYKIILAIEDEVGCTDTARLIIKAYVPKANFYSYDQLKCGSLSVQLYGYTSSAYNAVNTDYIWNLGNGKKDIGYAVTHKYEDTGQYKITLIVKDESGCRDTSSIAGFIKIVKPIANFTIDNVKECVPYTLKIKNTSLYSSNYTWSFNKSPVNIEKEPSPQVSIPGAYNIKLTVKGVDGCTHTKDTIYQIKGVVGKLKIDSTVGCTPYTPTLKVDNGINISKYRWDFGDFVSNFDETSGATVKHMYRTGQYRANVTIFSADGCSLNLKDNLIVDSAKAAFDIGETNFCERGTVTCINQSSGAYFSSFKQYIWQFGDGSRDVVEKTPAPHLYTIPSQYDISLKVISQYGCEDNTVRKKIVIITPSPLLTITPVAPQICLNDSLSFLPTIIISREDTVTNYQWKLDNEIVSPDSVFGYRFKKEKTYPIQLYIKTKNNCIKDASTSIIVRPLPVPVATPQKSIVCLGSNVQLNAYDGVSYQWWPAQNMQNSGTASPTVQPLKNTRYYVKVVNQYNCSQKDSIDIKIDKPVNLKYSSNEIICVGQSKQLKSSGNTQMFLWEPAYGLNNTTIANPIATPSKTTTYTVKGVSQNVCLSETGKIEVLVGDNPIVNAGIDKTVIAGTLVTLQAIGSKNITNYNWQPATGLSCINCPAPQLMADKNQKYIVTVTTAYNCNSSDEVNITVLCGKEAIYIPNAFTPNNDGNNDIFYIKGYGITTIKSMRIYNRYGKIVFEKQNITANDKTIGWNGAVNGKIEPGNNAFVYIVELLCNEGKSIIKKGTVLAIN